MLITAEKTTADPFVKRASQLFDLRLLEFRRAQKKLTTGWFGEIGMQSLALHNDENPVCYLLNPKSPDAPWDPLLVSIANEVRALSVRRAGNVHKAIAMRCNASVSPNVFLLDSNCMTDPKVQSNLVEAGCHRWMVIGDEITSHTEDKANTASNCDFGIKTIKALPAGEFLIHCTRARKGPWPNQQEEQFLDDLIFQESRSDHSATASLTRIKATGKLFASNRLTKDERKVVCFTAVQWDELESLRVYRSTWLAGFSACGNRDSQRGFGCSRRSASDLRRRNDLGVYGVRRSTVFISSPNQQRRAGNNSTGPKKGNGEWSAIWTYVNLARKTSLRSQSSKKRSSRHLLSNDRNRNPIATRSFGLVHRLVGKRKQVARRHIGSPGNCHSDTHRQFRNDFGKLTGLDQLAK